MPRGPLRLIKHHGIILCTTDGDPARDPRRICEISTGGDRDDNLFPSKLPDPPTALSSTGKKPRARYGYPICWSKEGYEWCPYLPAVVNFDYPIFRGMSSIPNIVHNGSGYSLAAEEMNMWQNVEYVMVAASDALTHGQLFSLDHAIPLPPSKYGYTRSHTQEKFAKKCVMKSLNAFQRLLGYCSFASAGGTLENLGGDSKKFYTDFWVSDLYKKLDAKNPDVHILTKLLVSTLWTITKARNYSGVVINYAEAYDYFAVEKMYSFGVPIYVSWPGPGPNPYRSFRQHHYLEPYFPTDEQLKTLETPPSTPTPVAQTSTIRYGVHPPAKTPKAYDHPLDYVKRRIQEIPGELARSPHRQAMLDRLASALKLVRMGSAKYFRFESTTVFDERTGGQKVCWVREELTKHYAKEDFQSAESRNLWFDCVSNQWNCSELLNIKDNEPSNEPEPLGYESEEMEVDEADARRFFEAEEAPQLCLTLEEGELVDEGGEPQPFLTLEDGELVSGQGDPAPERELSPVFNHDSLVRSLLASQFSPSGDLVDEWGDVEGFLWKRYGTRDSLEQEAHGSSEYFPLRVGLWKGRHDLSIVRLFNSVVDSTPLPRECDLSPAYELVDGEFPDRPPSIIPHFHAFEGGYLITINDGAIRPWKLLIKDPLTLVQAEREGWDLQGASFVSKLVRNGLPFEILYPSSHKDTRFYPADGPVLHPDGRSPTYSDYLGYRLDVADFFKCYPHAYAAALCGGGILWRIAIDTLPPPKEHELIRPFHYETCTFRVIDGQRYWTPALTETEAHVIVGVYKWADPAQSAKHDSWWPKPGAWTSSGLNFGVWTPGNEAWYDARKRSLDKGEAKAIQANNWKSSLKFERTNAVKFLSGARSLTRKFIERCL